MTSKKNIVSRALVCLVFVLAATSGFCFPADVASLNNREYFPAALERNNETSFLIDSPKLANQLLDEFSRIKLSRPEIRRGLGA